MKNMIDDLFNCIPANYSVRKHKGYLQHRKIYQLASVKNGRYQFRWHSRWVFTVLGLRQGKPGHASCFVAKCDGSFEEASIDHLQRITLNGKKYSSRYWNH